LFGGSLAFWNLAKNRCLLHDFFKSGLFTSTFL
jgi:hypothetical protein